jgi:hypothetical protein
MGALLAVTVLFVPQGFVVGLGALLSRLRVWGPVRPFSAKGARP